jgi:hypothetical protein
MRLVLIGTAVVASLATSLIGVSGVGGIQSTAAAMTTSTTIAMPTTTNPNPAAAFPLTVITPALNCDRGASATCRSGPRFWGLVHP